MEIRDAMEGDLPAVVEIYNATISGRMATADLEVIPVSSRRDWFREHNPTTRPLWVATADETVVGWLSFQSFYGRPAYSSTAEISVYVQPEHRRQGIARALITRAIDEAPHLGLKTLVGFIFAHNQPSLALFEGMGFERWGLLPRIAELDGVERSLSIVGQRIEETLHGP